MVFVPGPADRERPWFGLTCHFRARPVLGIPSSVAIGFAVGVLDTEVVRLCGWMRRGDRHLWACPPSRRHRMLFSSSSSMHLGKVLRPMPIDFSVTLVTMLALRSSNVHEFHVLRQVGS